MTDAYRAAVPQSTPAFILFVQIFGGLATSTVLNLLIMPTMMLNFGKFDNKNSMHSMS